jgi:aspartyl-tRNA(Asn)/glutamyl-tRNA(Gln) amidotransferase subunit C
MAIVTTQDILNIARISRLEIKQNEIDRMVNQLQSVLSYAERVTEVALDVQEPSNKNINIFRDDLPIKVDAEKSLAQAPQRIENFYVVPAILEKK